MSDKLIVAKLTNSFKDNKKVILILAILAVAVYLLYTSISGIVGLNTTNKIYCLGGGYGAFYAPIQGNGSVGSWAATSSYSIGPSASCAANSDAIYCIGGGTSNLPASNITFYSLLTNKGIRGFKATKSYPIPVYRAACTVSGGSIYCIGGATLNSTNFPYDINRSYYAPVSNVGIGQWKSAGDLPAGIGTVYACYSNNSNIYCEFLQDQSSYNFSLYTAYLSEQGIGQWTKVGSSNVTFYAGSMDTFSSTSSINNKFAYSVARPLSKGGSDQVFYASVLNQTLGTWLSTTSYPVYASDPVCVVN